MKKVFLLLSLSAVFASCSSGVRWETDGNVETYSKVQAFEKSE